MPIKAILIIAVIISGLMHLKAEYYGPDEQKYLFKPLTTVCILLIAGFTVTGNPQANFYKQMIVTGLFFSLWGDIFLMMPSDRFIAGLISFLIAHLFYIVAFSLNISQIVPFSYMIPFIVYGIVMFRFLSPGMGKLRIPVMLYITVIMTMVFLAMSRDLIMPNKYNLYAFIGALFFMASDSILAINKFRFQTKVSNAVLFLDSENIVETVKVKGSFKSAQFLILTTYYTAQVFIALSVH
jgi:uncharacterized membrane protein YhhN